MQKWIDVIVNPNNLIFLVIMIILAYKEIREIQKGTDVHYENIIVGLGLLGTFWGIFAGLQSFDTSKIQDSIPSLLDGMKTAFLTSIFGMGISLGLNFYKKVKMKNELTDDTEILKGLLVASEKQMHISKDGFDNVIQSNKDIKQSLEIKSNEITSLLSNALESLSKGATEEIIKALESVISDFNKNLTDQFGENFKQLNQAVHELVSWQQEYKVNIINTTNALEEVKKSLDSSTLMFGTVSKKSDSIIGMFDAAEKRASEFNQIAKSTADLITSISKSIEGIKATSDSVSKNLENVGNRINGSLSQQSETLTKLTEDIKKQLPDSLKQLNIALATLTNQFRTDYEFFVGKVRELTSGAFK